MNDSGFLKALEGFKKSQHEIGKNLEGLAVHYEKFSTEELRRLVNIRKNLDEYIEKNTDLKDICDFLDSLDIWAYKFTTGEEKTNENDSLYYITSSGVSLRLKMANKEKGLPEVIQPFMEHISFMEETYYPSETPKLGLVTSEYCSNEFYDIQKQNEVNEPFESKVKKYYKDGKLYFVEKPKNLYHEHAGNPVNKTFFSTTIDSKNL